jgi:hypothetical protein
MGKKFLTIGEGGRLNNLTSLNYPGVFAKKL